MTDSRPVFVKEGRISVPLQSECVLNAAIGLRNSDPICCAPPPYGPELQIWSCMPVWQFQCSWLPNQTVRRLHLRLPVPTSYTQSQISPRFDSPTIYFPFDLSNIGSSLRLSPGFITSVSGMPGKPPIVDSLKLGNTRDRSWSWMSAGFGIIWDSLQCSGFCTSVSQAFLSVILPTVNSPFHFLLLSIYTLAFSSAQAVAEMWNGGTLDHNSPVNGYKVVNNDGNLYRNLYLISIEWRGGYVTIERPMAKQFHSKRLKSGLLKNMWEPVVIYLVAACKMI